MGRPLSTDIASVWHRHTPKCRGQIAYYVGAVAYRTDGTSCRKCRGSQHTLELRWHALLTSLYMTREPIMVGDGVEVSVRDYRVSMGHDATFVCPLCRIRVSTHTGQVDRAREGGDYAPGNVAMVCEGCNMGREADPECIDVTAYRAAVTLANRRLVAGRGVARGPKAFTASMRRLVKGSQDRCSNLDGAVGALMRGPFGRQG